MVGDDAYKVFIPHLLTVLANKQLVAEAMSNEVFAKAYLKHRDGKKEFDPMTWETSFLLSMWMFENH